MATPHTTSWPLIQAAAAGSRPEREEFVRRYVPAVREYLGARWRRTRLEQEIEDAVQEVFLECFRSGGVLAKADPERPGGFRAFFYGVLRNVAARHEQRAGRQLDTAATTPSELDRAPGAVESASTLFDRAWARAILKEAAARQEQRARTAGDSAWRRFQILRLRFQEGLPIREIARLWQQDAAFLHHEYAAARKEFEAALREVVAEREPGSAADQDRILRELIDTLE